MPAAAVGPLRELWAPSHNPRMDGDS